MTEDYAGCIAVITNPHGDVLLQLRDDIPQICWPGHWSLPGGQREPGETWEQAVRREVQEETGIVLDAVREVTVTRHPSQVVRPAVFRANWEGSEKDLVIGEGQDLRFFPLVALPTPIPPHILDYIHQVTSLAPTL